MNLGLRGLGMSKKCKENHKNSPLKKDDWTEESLSDTWKIVKTIAEKKYDLTFYDPHFEVVSFEDMLHIYTGHLPITYDHWSFGKNYEELYKKYMNDRMGVAYEVVFNTSPALCYLLEHNTPTMQGLVMAHAAVGHTSFFKNNVLFKEQTNAGTIIPFLQNSKKFITECEEQHGPKAVEALLDVCHALQMYSFDRRPQKEKTYKEKEGIRLKRTLEKDSDYDTKVQTIRLKDEETIALKFARQREENILKFIGKFCPSLKPWQRQIIDIYCRTRQYLYPQMLTKLMNEGFASFWHHTIMTDMSDEGYIDAGGTIEFLHSHCSVLRQPDFDERGYYGFNPYKLGYEMFKDIKRICTDPTEEDKEWFPGLIGKNWIDEIKFAAYNFKDESFIRQYLSPKVIRDLKLFIVHDDNNESLMHVSDIHDDEGYRAIRSKLADHYNVISRIPDIYVEGWDAKRSRTLYLVCQEHNGCQLELSQDSGTADVLRLIKQLWPFPINFKIKSSDGDTNFEETG